jgi:Holliday junction DNA helicase RuvA
MIAYLKGILIEKTTNQVIIDVGGVGYCVQIPLSTLLKLGHINDQVELRIYTQMSDRSLSLFGFASEQEKDLFLNLINISGIGPKIGLNILSGIEVSDLEEAIRNSDVARISLVPGIGKKTAMRIALELQEKLEKKGEALDVHSLREKEDLISALLNLGFKRGETEKAVGETIKTKEPDTDFETLLRDSLKRLSRI